MGELADYSQRELATFQALPLRLFPGSPLVFSRLLATLKAEAARWQSVLQEPARRVSPAVTPSRLLPSKRPQLDWSAILKGLPNRFTAQDVAQKASKPIEQVYVHVSRWMKDKKVRKVEGGYQKVSQVA